MAKLRAPAAAPSRVVVANLQPQVAGGRFPVKRVVGERVVVTADVFTDGHDAVRAVLKHRPAARADWTETPLAPQGNDLWTGAFVVESLEPHVYTVEAWVDAFGTWRRDLAKRIAAEAATAVDLLVGAELVAAAALRAGRPDRKALESWAERLRAASRGSDPRRFHDGLEAELEGLVARWPDRGGASVFEPELVVDVDRPRARFGAWYEMFPRSSATEPGRHGTFADCERRLDYVAGMGFDVLYLPPIHPIGVRHRKGRNNQPEAGPDDVGSPWAIGNEDGGHVAVHPDLGTVEDFRRLVAAARERGLEIAMDVAFQCSPDHPWVKEHPEWFRGRPDGSIQYAENPPKKYEDIYPLHFETPDWKALWEELRGVFLFWAQQGVRAFRVDNPHTKPFRFWEWVIAEVRRSYPDAIFLSEAFTRPKVMYQLARIGFSQSYTYFAWRNTKREITDYMTELTATEVREFFRPNLWPNTPDILTEPLQYGGRALHAARVTLAATLGASYGIYGPAFELQDSRARTTGSEEYLDSEKYELRHWDLEQPHSLRDLVRRLNRIRNENEALHSNRTLRFHPIDNDLLIAYSKTDEALTNVVVTVVNLDPHHTQSGYLELPVESFGLDGDRPYQVHDLLTDARYFWSGPRNFVEIDPQSVPAHVFRVRRRIRTERDFDYFL